MLKLYYSPGACSLAPHIILHELKLTHDAIKVDLKAKTYVGGDYNEVNPKGSVPALRTMNGELLTEAAVILLYLSDQKPEAGLMPKTETWEHYRAQEWLNYIATELHKGFGPLWSPETPAAYKDIILKNLSKRFAYLNAHLEKNDYLMGTKFMAPDAYLFTVMNWTNFMKIDLSPWPHLKSFMERVRTRPATEAAFRAESLKI